MFFAGPWCQRGLRACLAGVLRRALVSPTCGEIETTMCSIAKHRVFMGHAIDSDRFSAWFGDNPTQRGFTRDPTAVC